MSDPVSQPPANPREDGPSSIAQGTRKAEEPDRLMERQHQI